MNNEINIGDKKYFVQLDSFQMADQTNQVECRIAPVVIDGKHQYKEDAPVYIFQIGEAQRHTTDENLFNSVEEAQKAANEKIKWITVRVLPSNEEIEKENAEKQAKLEEEAAKAE